MCSFFSRRGQSAEFFYDAEDAVKNYVFIPPHFALFAPLRSLREKKFSKEKATERSDVQQIYLYACLLPERLSVYSV
jgi:hypothetical protein